MNMLKYCRAGLVTLACLGIVLPGTLWAETPDPAAPTATSQSPGGQVVRDVALGAGGMLAGTVFHVQGQPSPRQVVILTQGRRELARTVTDGQGRFAFAELRGGVYGLSVDRVPQVFRVWTSRAAPPNSISHVALVTGGPVQRGQRPFCELFVCDPVVLGVVLAAAIAIPVAVHNTRSHRPAS